VGCFQCRLSKGNEYYFVREGSDREKEFFEDLLTGLDLFNVPSMNHPLFSKFYSRMGECWN
jgi:hypothetical protein